jgi:ATP-dependent Clp protease ATP-binding subunit ClpA
MTEQPKFTPRMYQTFGAAKEIALAHGHRHIGTEHFLLAFLHDEGGIAGSLLRKLGVTDTAIEQLEAILSSEGYNTPADPPTRPSPGSGEVG